MTYVYTGDEPIGGGNAGLTPGTEVRVRERTDDTVTVAWNVPVIVHKTERGNERGFAERALSIPVSTFDAIFKEA